MKLKVTRGIECGERGYGDESGECGFRGEWNGGVGCGSNRVKLRFNVEMRMVIRVVNVEMRVEMVMLKGHCRVRGEWDGGVECGYENCGVECGDENGYGSGECGNECGDGHGDLLP